MEIISASRGTMRVAVDGRTITLSGEGMPPGGAVDYYLDLASIRTWDDGEPVSEQDRERIIRELPEVALRTDCKLRFD